MQKSKTVKGNWFARQLKSWLYGRISQELSHILKYFDKTVQVLKLPHDEDIIFQGLDIRNKIQVDAVDKLSPHLTGAESRNAILLNGNFNFSLDIQTLLQSLRPQISRHSRIFVICYNSYLRGPLRFASKIGLRTGPDVDTFLTRSDIHNLARLSGFEALSHRPVAHFPFRLFGIGTFLDRLLVALPLFKWLGVSTISVLRPIGPDERKLDLSILIPARNERGNIEPAVKRILELPIPVREVIFVEGHSSDETWNEIQRVSQHYRDLIKIKTIQQTGRGKADAVRIGFTLAEGDLLTILDADLTMPPEDLPKFYNAYKSGLADFVNGSRLVYPMEGEAMRFLNRLGNLFFARWISLLLNTHLNDTLCGTKFFARLDYLRFVQWRKDFGDFDPFGDFDLVFPAVVMNLGVIEVPIHYRARVYGSTQIRRFYHGAMLLKMCTIAFFKISIGQSDVSNKS